MKLKLRDINNFLRISIIYFLFVCMAIVCSLGQWGIFCAILVLLFIIYMICFCIGNGKNLERICLIPIILSCFQNVYLGWLSPNLTKIDVQILTILNFIVAIFIFAFSFLSTKKNERNHDGLLNLFILIFFFLMVSVAWSSTRNPISILSSLRNIISVFLFYFIGYYCEKKINFSRFEKMILFLALIIIVIGLFDELTGFKMWNALHITDLWTKKGIKVQASSGLPTNFYSSETINGHRIRRMVSTFADPVNLGTFLFAAFCISWHQRKKIISVLLVICIFLTVSKGAWLGLLIFFCVYAYKKFSRSIFTFTVIFAGLIGAIFLIYAARTSAASVFLHMSGLVSAFKSVIRHPLGNGIGSLGVLAKQFSQYSANSDITETGLGLIIGQLGFAGLIIYVLFFYRLFKFSSKIQEPRDFILVITLLLSIFANILFNEVALSPNSCGLYMLIVGIKCRELKLQRRVLE